MTPQKPKKNPKRNLRVPQALKPRKTKSSKVPAEGKSPATQNGPANPGPEDTICGIATPPGEGGIGIIRISGIDAIELASRALRFSDKTALSGWKTHTVHHGELAAPDTGERIDEVMVALFRAPRTYTREDTVEVFCHGGAFLLRRALDLFVSCGCRLARPGEFTQRAFLNGRIDLTRAEAVMDLISAKSEAARRLAFGQLNGGLFRPISGLRQDLIGLLAEVEAGLDFIEEDIQFVSGKETSAALDRIRRKIAGLLRSSSSGRMVREGIRVAIVGSPNVGKSSLLNALLDADRAIVSPHPGTTRDLVEDQLVLGGINFRLVDTAGFRDSRNPIERDGIKRAKSAISESDLVLLVLDASEPPEPSKENPVKEGWEAEIGGRLHLVILNKIDLLGEKFPGRPHPGRKDGIPVSALTGQGMEELKEKLKDLVL
ncbi:MAG TPA: tRNA uridine-5-carboxymethylaminomethyl(34) synthesis GTPase MnmE, partial [Nitrospiria bacterium]